MPDDMVNVGAFTCPEWFAEAIIVLIEFEACKQGLKAGANARESATEWLRKYSSGKT